MLVLRMVVGPIFGLVAFQGNYRRSKTNSNYFFGIQKTYKSSVIWVNGSSCSFYCSDEKVHRVLLKFG